MNVAMMVPCLIAAFGRHMTGLWNAAKFVYELISGKKPSFGDYTKNEVVLIVAAVGVCLPFLISQIPSGTWEYLKNLGIGKKTIIDEIAKKNPEIKSSFPELYGSGNGNTGGNNSNNNGGNNNNGSDGLLQNPIAKFLIGGFLAKQMFG